MMQRKSIPGGIFLLFLLFCAIITCIHPDTTTDTSFTEITYTEETISLENVIPTEDVTSIGDTLICTAVIDGDTFNLETGEKVRLIGIDAPELSQPGGKMFMEKEFHSGEDVIQYERIL